MAKAKAKPKLTDKEQSERFRETARNLNVEEAPGDFEAKFKQIVPAKAKKLAK